jgi:hypothetical protein
VLPRPARVRLSPLARTTLLLTVASGALALMPLPSATSLPLPATTRAAARPGDAHALPGTGRRARVRTARPARSASAG